MTSAERYEIVAELFKSSTGFIAPGKSLPPHFAECGEQYEIDRQHAWAHWKEESKWEAALQMIAYLQSKVNHFHEEQEAFAEEIRNGFKDLQLVEKERDQYKKLWATRGKALEQPCLACGYNGNQIRMKNGEIP